MEEPKTDFSRATILTRRPLGTCIFFEFFLKKRKSDESKESGFRLIHRIFVGSEFIGMIILFWMLPKKRKILFGFRIRIRAFPKEMYPKRPARMPVIYSCMKRKSFFLLSTPCSTVGCCADVKEKDNHLVPVYSVLITARVIPFFVCRMRSLV